MSKKLHAAVAKSAFWSQNVQKTSGLDRVLKFGCRKNALRCGEKRIFKWKWTRHLILRSTFEVLMSKNARRCGEKHIWKWKCTKHVSFGALFGGLMRKTCTPLWREARSLVKMFKKLTVSEHFWRSQEEKLDGAVARSTLTSQNVKKLTVSQHVLKVSGGKIARRCGEKHARKSKC